MENFTNYLCVYNKQIQKLLKILFIFHRKTTDFSGDNLSGGGNSPGKTRKKGMRKPLFVDLKT